LMNKCERGTLRIPRPKDLVACTRQDNASMRPVAL